MGNKATFVIDEDIMRQARESVKKGVFKSLSALVENAIKDELEKIKREQIRKEILQASEDPLFISDIKEIEEDFKYSDFE